MLQLSLKGQLNGAFENPILWQRRVQKVSKSIRCIWRSGSGSCMSV